ncbi:hypothetical protein NE865_16044 [Phthorimaea operculella]|nr:hypothetical protein NE865_16044 [Phthorimaea operculella]
MVDEKEQEHPMKSGGLKPLNVHSNNMPLEWKNWLTSLKIYLRANLLEKSADSRKVAILLHHIGTEALSIFYSFGLDIDSVAYDDLVKKFESHFLPKVNVTIERHKLFNRRQGDEESIDQYVTDLRNIASQCDFKTLEDDLLKDIFSWNLNSKNQFIKEKILQDKPESLDKAVEIAKTQEASRIQAKIIETPPSISVAEVVARARPRQNSNSRHSSQTVRTRSNSRSRPSSSSNQQRQAQANHRVCSRCGQVHRFKCPAIGVTCKVCNRPNHFAVMCRLKKTVNMVNQQDDDEPEEDTLFIGTVTNNTKNGKWFTDIIINNKNVKCLLDSGADTNLISYNTYINLRLDTTDIQPSKSTLSTFSGEILPTVGQCRINITHRDRPYLINFHIIDMDCQSTLGREACTELNLVKRVNTVSFSQTAQLDHHSIIEKNKDLFEGLGCIRDFEVNLALKPDVKPSVEACRRCVDTWNNNSGRFTAS